jgi:3-carboxy-cis,cis-muconate cycloisomerase
MSDPSLSVGLFAPLFADPDVDDAVGDAALVASMLTFESALAAAQAELGLVPPEAAAAIAAAAGAVSVDPARLGEQSVSAGNPVNPLVRRLTAAVPESARPFVHLGATSQDVLDTAVMLTAAWAGRRILERLDTAADLLAELVETHRRTTMPGRTLGQQALPTTLGRVAAGWLNALTEAAERLETVRTSRLAVQFGGAAGTLAGLDGRGPEVLTRLAARLGLAEPTLPWHTDRLRVLELASAAAGVTATAGTIGLDLVLLAQAEIAEVVPATGGGSTAMPHKANPVDAVLIRSAAFRTPGLLATLFAAAGAQENERAAGAWHAEWLTLRELLSVTGGAALRLTAAVAGLRVDAGRMRADLELSGGLLMSESVAARLAPRLGRVVAHELVRDCARRAVGQSFDAVLRADPQVRELLDDDEISAALDPAGWTGSTDALIDRALGARRRRSGGASDGRRRPA